jgi:type III secretory pathway lipoprotein EscJ
VKSLPVILLGVLAGCCTKPVLVPVAAVHYDGFKDGREIIATLRAEGIPATPEGEATVVFPILVPESKFELAVSILRTNSLVTSGKVRLYTTITRQVKRRP